MCAEAYGVMALRCGGVGGAGRGAGRSHPGTERERKSPRHAGVSREEARGQISCVTRLGYQCKGLMPWVSWCVGLQEEGGPVTVTLQHKVRHTSHTLIDLLTDQGVLALVALARTLI